TGANFTISRNLYFNYSLLAEPSDPLTFTILSTLNTNKLYALLNKLGNIGKHTPLLPTTRNLSQNLRYPLTMPSFGITIRRPELGKSPKPYSKGIEFNFYPAFLCRKPKLKLSFKKFDFLPPSKEPNWWEH